MVKSKPNTVVTNVAQFVSILKVEDYEFQKWQTLSAFVDHEEAIADIHPGQRVILSKLKILNATNVSHRFKFFNSDIENEFQEDYYFAPKIDDRSWIYYDSNSFEILTSTCNKQQSEFNPHQINRLNGPDYKQLFFKLDLFANDPAGTKRIEDDKRILETHSFIDMKKFKVKQTKIIKDHVQDREYLQCAGVSNLFRFINKETKAKEESKREDGTKK